MRVFLISVLMLTANLLLGQNELYYHVPQVQTLRAYVANDERSIPIITLGSEDRVVVEFDYMGANIPDLEYTIQHCDRNGRPSDLQPSEYMNGFVTNLLTDYSVSVATTQSYTHFGICLPNDDVELLLSGCYVLTVTQAGTNYVIARTAFFVCEQLTTIELSVRKPQLTADSRHMHDVALSVDIGGLPIGNIFDELNIGLLQNGCPYSAVIDMKPRQIAGTKLVYSYFGDLLMAGGNEFRRLDLRYLRQTPANYNRVDFDGSFFHVSPATDESRAFKPYFTDEDQNGQFIIYANSPTRTTDFFRSADYVYVHPTLASEPVLDGDVFVCGAFNGWQLDSTNLMRYNFEQQRYESDLLLKQGVYDYIYVCRNSYTAQVDMERFEGSHSETANSYLVMVFFKPANADYEQLVGVLVSE